MRICRLSLDLPALLFIKTMVPQPRLLGAARLALRVALRAIKLACGQLVERLFVCQGFEYST